MATQKAPYAVIDMGTNTFHLLIGRTGPEGGLEELYRESRFVKLAEGGIGHIAPAPYARAMDTMRHFQGILQAHGVQEVRAIGTAALRTADNAPALLAQLADELGMHVRSVDGDEEARLIHKGVSLAVPLQKKPSLIMDIGGGSVEFIIANAEGIVWQESFPTGLAVLCQKFQPSEPIQNSEMEAIHDYLFDAWRPLYRTLAQWEAHTNHLIGAAGTFDLLTTLMLPTPPDPAATAIELPLDLFPPVCHTILASDREARMAHPGIPPERVDMIVMAFMLVVHALGTLHTRRLTASTYSLKEGVMAEMLEAR